MLVSGYEMHNTFLPIQSKLQPPTLAETTVPRPRLQLLKNKKLPKEKLVTVIAPAGYGKSTLMAQWWQEVTENSFKTCWLSLGEEDNNPSQFLEYLVANIKNLGSPFNLDIIEKLHVKEFTNLNTVINLLIQALQKSSKPVVFFLDDLHLLQDPTSKSLLKYFISYAPKNVSWIIAKRRQANKEFHFYQKKYTVF